MKQPYIYRKYDFLISAQKFNNSENKLDDVKKKLLQNVKTNVTVVL